MARFGAGPRAAARPAGPCALFPHADGIVLKRLFVSYPLYFLKSSRFLPNCADFTPVHESVRRSAADASADSRTNTVVDTRLRWAYARLPLAHDPPHDGDRPAVVEYAAMSDVPENGADEPAREPGVFGKLPRSRPGVRSPLRSGESEPEVETAAEAERGEPGETAAPAASQPAAAPSPAAETGAPRTSPPPPPPSRPEPEPESPGPEHGGGLEEIAWAGITVAAEAATLGVRLASRALGAVREAVERR
jgi:hypothetical protein